nr:MAG TPA: hypothetical protein [Caudoviricetes sp.]
MLATKKQIDYLCYLAERVEKIKRINENKKVIVSILPDFIDWKTEKKYGVTTIDASVRIKSYNKIIQNCNIIFCLCGLRQV